jgi:nucleotide-binding universal stress UspA family protein
MNTRPAPSPPSTSSGKHVLVPLELVRGTTEALRRLQQMVFDGPCAVTLLHVVEANVVPMSETLYPDLCAEAESALRRVAGHFFGREDAVTVRVRVGRACEQIVAEARDIRSELILLSAPKRRWWRRWLQPGTTERVMRSAPCPILIVPDSATMAGPACPADRNMPVSRTPRLRPTWAEM